MKKLILLLLFIPLVSFGQVDSGMSLNRNIDDLYVSGTRIVDIKSQFVRDSIEGNKSTKWMYYNQKDHRFSLLFSRNYLLVDFFGTD